MEPDPIGAYVTPERGIKLPADMVKWEKSQAHSELLGFISGLNRAVAGRALTAQYPVSDAILRLRSALDELSSMTDSCPPVQQPQRFGNVAFRKWFEALKRESPALLEKVVPSDKAAAVDEIRVYFEESFGNSTRIDYGTGHEASFVMFLYCLYRIGVLKCEDKVATVCVVFNRYLELVRRLQLLYKMEPAGSHGVWSLDDYQFVPFIWGSSQLVGHSIIEPHKFLDEEILDKYENDFMFLSCIQYIKKVKTGPFAEHSNQLWGISAVPSWTKINQGLLKMYEKEVLGKFPVVQHILFGSMLTLQPPTPQTSIKYYLENNVN